MRTGASKKAAPSSLPKPTQPSLKVERRERRGLEREGGVARKEAHPRVPHRARHRGGVAELGVPGALVACWRCNFPQLIHNLEGAANGSAYGDSIYDVRIGGCIQQEGNGPIYLR